MASTPTDITMIAMMPITLGLRSVKAFTANLPSWHH